MGRVGSLTWQDQAECRDRNPAIFYEPLDDEEDTRWYPNLAKAICAICPVKKACLLAGKNEPLGIRGGLTPDERQASTHRGILNVCSACGRNPRNPNTGTCAECAKSRESVENWQRKEAHANNSHYS